MEIKIVDHRRFERILDRLAYQILERNYGYSRLSMVGIEPRGDNLARLLVARLVKLGLDVDFQSLKVDKDKPNPKEIELEASINANKDSPIILVDDVLYTGKTLMNALVPFIHLGARQVQVLVLVDRDYIAYPVKPDFTGMSLATTTQENVKVILDEKEYSVWLE